LGHFSAEFSVIISNKQHKNNKFKTYSFDEHYMIVENGEPIEENDVTGAKIRVSQKQRLGQSFLRKNGVDSRDKE